MRIRRHEWVLVGYFAYTSVLALALPVHPSVTRAVLAMNLIVLAGLALLAAAESIRHRPVLSVLRDWYPLPLILLAYREMGWFAPAHHTYAIERVFETWDNWLLAGFKPAIEATGPLLPGILELAYAIVYAVPAFALGMLYAFGVRRRSEGLLLRVVLATLVVYALLWLFPSEPPRTVFPGEDFPAYNGLFRRFNWWLLVGYGIHTGVFPSAHVASSFAAAFGLRRVLPEQPWLGRLLMVVASLIAVATVYGRYHYAADAVAGFAVSLAVDALARSALLGSGVRAR